MFVLRCTRKLLARIDQDIHDGEPPRSTTRLGDWTANVLVSGRTQLVLAVSNLTLLPILLPAAPYRTVPARLPAAVGDMLRALSIDDAKVAAELAAMREPVLAPTNDRRVLGSMNDFDRMLESYLGGRSLLEVARCLAEAPCGPIGMASPDDETVRLFSAPRLRLV
jgi:hypothetical protein